MDLTQPRSLKQCLATLLNAHIEGDVMPDSSIIYARGTLALFSFFMREPAPIRGLFLPSPWNQAYDRGKKYILANCVAILTEEDL